MESFKIGIIGGGFQGKSEAYWFAKRNVDVIVYEISQRQRAMVYEEMGASPKSHKYLKHIKLTDHLEDLRDCCLVIENIPENKEMKYKILKEVEKVVTEDTIIASNSSSYLPTFLAEALENKSRFMNIHFLGVSWGINDLELIPSQYTSQETVEKTNELMEYLGFYPVVMKECAGFIFNRINGMELSNLFRAMEVYKLADLDTITKYLLYPIRGQWTVAFIDLLGVEISKALFDYLHEMFGDRAHISEYLNGRVERNELGVKTGKGFYDYPSTKVDPTILIKKTERNVKSKYQHIFVNNVAINQLNLLLALVNKGKTVYMDTIDTPCFKVLERTDKHIYDKVAGNIILAKDTDVEFDLVLDSKIATFEEAVESINQLSERFGADKPILVNTPIYRLKDLAKATEHPLERLAVINCQKSFICNTELVKNPGYSEEIYDEIKSFIIEITGGCLEVNDGYTRPLMFLLITKMFESIRCLEEGIASRDEIVRLMQKEAIFKDADYMGLGTLKFLSEYLFNIYGQPFEAPKLLLDMVAENKCGVMNGNGFYEYPGVLAAVVHS
ncbi:hypothetical protein acsn021_19740 [Anaerocolumna cellulosilytica]|uniref:Uncharacterized protein n=1 Tax=Anaerocolumna cellulosilytica TaxID=433286 RepID=A0A6S6R4P4_9FIRM|nr:3-hydroxyacyl-CoA dehydrogenase NAD-binding domain-containing protein [Anaerocolumna cellulosilytica]MBB5196473.1 3-hydroxyacyl-CoA dehydrogenase [Anaerocolumna cellulosilytica]BCJ94405.1 hypothetical protein acsn021_19740 [Anaerocolumna cellulosilytica]